MFSQILIFYSFRSRLRTFVLNMRQFVDILISIWSAFQRRTDCTKKDEFMKSEVVEGEEEAYCFLAEGFDRDWSI